MDDKRDSQESVKLAHFDDNDDDVWLLNDDHDCAW